MARTVQIHPITRIEGHLGVSIDVNNGKVVSARSSGEMFRGFEVILKGRHPLDAQQITQRICGVCPIAHGTASILAQDAAYRVTPPDNGRIMRNLIFGANYIQSHILHFYHLAALDYIDITAVASYKGSDQRLGSVRDWVKSQLSAKTTFAATPFLPRYKGTYSNSQALNIGGVKHYLEALDMRAKAHECLAIFGGKAPHAATLVPGGLTEKVSADKITAYRARMQELLHFTETCYIPDVVSVAKAFSSYFRVGRGCGNFMSYGVFPETSGNFLPSGIIIDGSLENLDIQQIHEDVGYSRFSSRSGLHPSEGATRPDAHKNNAYSWLKAPRYRDQAVEVGPLARILVAYMKGDKPVKREVDTLRNQLGIGIDNLNSVMGRHAARAIECRLVARRCLEWLDELSPDKPGFQDYSIPASASGVGLTEAPRGALGHWISIRNGKIDNYQCVVPTTWNCSPRDDRDQPGPVEKALEGTPIANRDNPIEATRVVRSFDPCMACAVH